MNFTDLEKRLKAYTPVEKAILDGSLSPEDAGKFSHVPAAAGRAGAFVISMNEFISPGENIGIHRQDRFCGVAPHSHDYIELAYLWSEAAYRKSKDRDRRAGKGIFAFLTPRRCMPLDLPGKRIWSSTSSCGRNFFIPS